MKPEKNKYSEYNENLYFFNFKYIINDIKPIKYKPIEIKNKLLCNFIKTKVPKQELLSIIA